MTFIIPFSRVVALYVRLQLRTVHESAAARFTLVGPDVAMGQHVAFQILASRKFFPAGRAFEILHVGVDAVVLFQLVP